MKKIIFVIFFLFSVLEFSCKSRGPHSGGGGAPDPDPDLITNYREAMKSFKVGQDIINEGVPKLANGSDFNQYAPFPLVSFDTGKYHKAANQAYAGDTQGKDLLKDARRDREYFSNIAKAKNLQGNTTSNHLRILKDVRRPYLNDYMKSSLNSFVVGQKFFAPETSIKSNSFFDFFMGLLGKKHRRPNDTIASMLQWELKIGEGAYPRAHKTLASTDIILLKASREEVKAFKYLKSDNEEVVQDFNSKQTSRFLFLTKARVEKNAHWFKDEPEISTLNTGIYIPYLGRDEEAHKADIVRNVEDLSNWVKKASKSIFDTIPEGDLQDEISIKSHSNFKKIEDFVYYLESDGKLVRLTKKALATF